MKLARFHRHRRRCVGRRGRSSSSAIRRRDGGGWHHDLSTVRGARVRRRFWRRPAPASAWRTSTPTAGRISISSTAAIAKRRGRVTKRAVSKQPTTARSPTSRTRPECPGPPTDSGCVWGDYDNDGRSDLYVTQYGRNVLYHNNGDGMFSDVTEKARVDGIGLRHQVPYRRDVLRLRSRWASGSVRRQLRRIRAGEPPDLLVGFGLEASCPPSAISRDARRALPQQRRRDLHQRHQGGGHVPAQGQEPLRGRHSITTTMAGRICSSPTTAWRRIFTTTSATARSRTSPPAPALRLPKAARPWRPCASRWATTTTTDCWTSTSPTSRTARPHLAERRARLLRRGERTRPASPARRVEC